MEDGKQRRTHRLRVVVDNTEKAAIEEAAQACGQSVSTYLRNLGLGYIPTSQMDKKHVLELVKISSDQGRLGGLLKMWLTNEERQEEVIGAQVRRTLDQINETQQQLLELVKQL